MKFRSLAISISALFLLSLSSMGCVSLVVGTATNAAMKAEVVKAYYEKSDSDSIMVNIPIERDTTGAMLHIEKLISRADKSVSYTVKVDYLSTTYDQTVYDSIKLKSGDSVLSLEALDPVRSTSYATMEFQGNKYTCQYVPDSKNQGTKIDTTSMSNLIATVITNKALTVHNYMKDSDKFIAYDLTADEAGFFSQLQ
jgi:hypothetical protein